MNTEDFSALINQILPGLQFFVRDMDLSPENLAEYRIGNLLNEPAFVDISSLTHVGLDANNRFYVLSNNARDILSTIPTDQMDNNSLFLQEAGMVVLERDSLFLVVDVFAEGITSMVTLLHIPPNLSGIAKKYFNNDVLPQITIEREDKEVELFSWLKDRARQLFDETKELPPNHLFTDDRWKKRISFAIGLDIGR